MSNILLLKESISENGSREACGDFSMLGSLIFPKLAGAVGYGTKYILDICSTLIQDNIGFTDLSFNYQDS